MWNSPHCHEHIKNTSICGTTVPENWLETARKSCTAKAERKKDPHGIGWKGVRRGQVGAYAPGRGLGERGDYPARDPSWEVSGSRQTLGLSILVSNPEKRGPLAGWRAWAPDKRAVRSLDRTWEEAACASLHMKQGREDRLKLWGWLTGLLGPPGAGPSLSWVSIPAPLTSCCCSTLEQGLLWQRKELCHELEVARPEVGSEQGEAGISIIYTDSASEAAQTSLCSQIAAAYSPHTWRVPVDSSLGQGNHSWGGVRAYPKETETFVLKPQGVCSGSLGPTPAPGRTVVSTEQGGSLARTWFWL